MRLWRIPLPELTGATMEGSGPPGAPCHNGIRAASGKRLGTSKDTLARSVFYDVGLDFQVAGSGRCAILPRSLRWPWCRDWAATGEAPMKRDDAQARRQTMDAR